jgi:hypothetical protein
MNEQSDPKEDVDNTGRDREFLLESGFYDEGGNDGHVIRCQSKLCPCYVEGMKTGLVLGHLQETTNGLIKENQKLIGEMKKQRDAWRTKNF